MDQRTEPLPSDESNKPLPSFVFPSTARFDILLVLITGLTFLLAGSALTLAYLYTLTPLNALVLGVQPDFDDSAWTPAATVECLTTALARLQLQAKWIWLPGCAQRKESVLVRKTFDLPNTQVQGTLRVRAEHAQVSINGHSLGTIPLWTTEHWYDLSPYLRQGKNVLAFQVSHDRDAGYGALLFRATILGQ